MSPEEQLITKIIKSLVDDLESVKISATISEHTAVYDISVSDKDVGKVLGKKGSHADALRTIFGAIYGRVGKKLHLRIIDPKKVNKPRGK